MPPTQPSAPPAAQLRLALVAEAARKSRVCWLSWAGGPPRLVWHAWYDDALVVVSRDGGQDLTGLTSTAVGTVEVTFRSKDTGGELVRWEGRPTVVDPASPSWEAHAAALLAVRLNLADPAATVEAWRSDAAVVRVEPALGAGKPGSGPLP